jgi:hypothetical protein
MFRKIAIIAVTGLAAVASVSAGQIQLGQTISGVNDGLTTTYMTSGGSTGSSTLKNYDLNLFSNGTNSGTPPTPFIGYSNTAGVASTPGSTLVDSSGVTFDMISQTGSNGNFWDLLSTSPTITIPAGVFDVKTVWMMMNNLYGVGGSNDTDVKFTFDNAANGSDAGSLNTVTVDLVNGTEIRDAVDCTNVTSSCTLLTYGTGLAPMTTVATTVTGSGPSSLNIAARNIVTTAYNTGSAAPYANTSGNLVLDEQGFGFGSAFASQYLVSIQVTDDSGALNVSRTAVSAVTLITATPEPSSVLLLLTGFGMLCFTVLKRKRLQKS